MKTFPSFNQSNNAICPVCKTNEDCETVLVPIPGTEKGGIMEARQVHKKCYDLIIEKVIKTLVGEIKLAQKIQALISARARYDTIIGDVGISLKDALEIIKMVDDGAM